LAYKGIIKGNTIELEDTLALPEGTRVEVEVKKHTKRGNPQAILNYLKMSKGCKLEDITALQKEIDQGKKKVRIDNSR